MDVVQRASEELAPYARGLILATLGRIDGDPAQAEIVLNAAEKLGVDALRFCIHRFKLNEEEALGRAVHWAGFPFSPVVPSVVSGMQPVDRLDRLAEVRSYRGMLFDREVAFCAAGFDELVRLAIAYARNPAIARHICFVPPRALRSFLATAHSGQLLAEARQRLTRRWPYASANVDLPIAVRVAFVAAFGLATVAAAIAPFFLRELLLPFIAVLFLLPALLKLVAAFAKLPPVETPRVLNDAELPVYSVLIPLRDEAGMVPLLRRAMVGLDYPALCIKRTSAC